MFFSLIVCSSCSVLFFCPTFPLLLIPLSSSSSSAFFLCGNYQQRGPCKCWGAGGAESCAKPAGNAGQPRGGPAGKGPGVLCPACSEPPIAAAGRLPVKAVCPGDLLPRALDYLTCWAKMTFNGSNFHHSYLHGCDNRPGVQSHFIGSQQKSMSVNA